MPGPAFSGKTNRTTTDGASQQSSAGENAVALAPPAYGMEFVDRGAAGWPVAELQRDVERIKDELDSVVYTEGVEETVIGILRDWATRGTLASGYLDWIFDGLQMPKSGVFSDTTYYDAMLDDFDRANEVRHLRDSTKRYRGRESADESRRQAEAAAERRETDVAADAAGGWTQNVAEGYDLPATPQNLARAKLEVLRLSMIPSDRLLPIERAASELVSQDGPEALLRRVHFDTEFQRIERRKAQMRAIARPLLEILLWVTAERLAAFAIEAVAARLFAGEVGTATALAAEEVAVSALARRGAAEGGLVSAEGSLIVREGYTYQIQSLNPITGEAVAMGRNLSTGEVVTVRLNIDTGACVATRASGETLAIRGGRVDMPGARSGLIEGAPKGGAIVRGEVEASAALQGPRAAEIAPQGTLGEQLQAMEQRLEALGNQSKVPVLRRDLEYIKMWAGKGREMEARELLKSLSKRVKVEEFSRSGEMLSPLLSEAEAEAAGMRIIEYHPEGASVAVQLDKTAPAAYDQTGQRLLAHVERAMHRFEQEGLTEAQLTALRGLERTERRTLYDAYRGSRIDEFAKESVMADQELEHVYVTVIREKGPDFFDSTTGFWYDMTTTQAWKQHVRDYGKGRGFLQAAKEGKKAVPGFRLPTEVLP